MKLHGTPIGTTPSHYRGASVRRLVALGQRLHLVDVLEVQLLP